MIRPHVAESVNVTKRDLVAVRHLKAPRAAALVETADEPVVDRAVIEIKAILGRTIAKGIAEVGGYLLRTFYNDDPAMVHSHAPTKHASIRKLVERCGSVDLPVSRSFLSNAIRLAVQARMIPTTSKYHGLPPSHRIALLSVTDPKVVEQLADDAIDNGMTFAKLRKRVARLHPKKGREQRRIVQPEALQAARLIVSTLVNQETGHLAFSRSDLEALDDAQRHEIREAVGRATILLERLRKLVPS